MDKLNSLYGKDGPHEQDSEDELNYLTQLGENDYEDPSSMENVSGEKKRRAATNVGNPYKRKKESEEKEDKKVVERNPYEKRGGEDRIYYGGMGQINTVTACFVENHHAKRHWKAGRAVVWVECKLFHPRSSLYPVKGYSKHLVDTSLVKKSHSYLNGMFAVWRSSVMQLLADAMNADMYDDDHLELQYQFASRKLMRAMAGIQEHTEFPVHILAKSPLMNLVKGVDDSEMADLVMKMARCRVFSVIAFPSKIKDDIFHVVTRFDGDNNLQQCYGIKKGQKNKKTAYETVKGNRTK